MADTPLSLPGTTGSLSGWQAIDVDPTGTPDAGTPRRFSTRQLLAYLDELRGLFDPAALRDLEAQIQDHLQNTDNPHNDRIASLITDITTQVLAPCLPGVAPSVEPALAVLAAFPDPWTWQVERSSPVTVVDPTGFLQTVAADTIAIDHTTGVPLIALYPARTNQLPNSSPEVAGQGLGASLNSKTLTGVLTPNRSASVWAVRADASTGSHGYSVTAPLAAGAESVASLFVFPLHSAATHLKLTARYEPEVWVLIDLASGAVVDSAGICQGLVAVLPNGWWRLGLQYTPSAGTSQILDVTLYRQGQEVWLGDSTDLFAVFCPMVGPGVGLGPVIETSGSERTCAQATLRLATNTSTPLQSGALAVTYAATPSLAGALANLANLAGTARVGLAGDRVSLSFADTTPAVADTSTAMLANTLCTAAMRWSPGEVSHRHSGTSRVTHTLSAGASVPAGGDLILGPLPGGLADVVMYASSDDINILEFLVGEAL